jgi:hypothetical protein
MVKGKPVIPVLRHLARSGGTVISRCVGCMQGVVLLSEVHPANMAVTQPVKQARAWFGLVTDADITRWKRAGPPTMLQFLALCEQRARAKGRRLVIRDWTHMDYIGVPYGRPAMGFALKDALGGAYEVAEAVTVRHPLDQFISLAKMHIMQGRLTPEGYLRGCAAFAAHAADVGFVRYEDFTHDPETALRTLCERLTIAYDPSWRERWASYRTITGDVPEGGSRGASSAEIRPLPRAAAPEGLRERFLANDDYHASCRLLGYEP